MKGISDRRHYAKRVTHGKVSPLQKCNKCKGTIRLMDWWARTEEAFHFKYAVLCGSCTHIKRHPVRADDGSTYYLVKPRGVS